MNFEELPKRKYISFETPIEKMETLSNLLEGPQIYMKRDDQLSLAAGGNKTRKLEYLMADVKKNQADTVITCGAIQSNHCRLTLSASIKENLNCVLVLEERIPNSYDPNASGNNFLFKLMDPEDIIIVPKGTNMPEKMKEVAEKLKEKGQKPYIIPGGGSNEIGTSGYISGAKEIVKQMKTEDLNFDYIAVASGSGGTHAGLLIGLLLENQDIPVIGFNIARSKEEQETLMKNLISKTLDFLEIKQSIPDDKIICNDKYLGEGYSLATKEMIESVQLLAKKEGILLDPVYTGKAMAGLIDLIRKNHFKPTDNILFIHTGGSPALYDKQETVLQK